MAKEHRKLRIVMRNIIYFVYRVRYIINGMMSETDEKFVIFSAYNGKSYACSPKAVYEYMAFDKKFSDYKFIWLFNYPENYKFLEKNRNTIVVKNKSIECERYLHMAKFWIFNFRALDYWKPKKNQVYVQCWHGTPLKKLGFDIENSDNAMNSVNEIRNKYRTDAKRLKYLLSPCEFVTERFKSAWNLKKFGKEEAVIEIGYPRNDFLNKYSNKDVFYAKKKIGIGESDKKIILYAPTWRDNQYNSEEGYTYSNSVDFDFIRKCLNNDFIILFRAHYLVADNFDFSAYKGFIYDVSTYDDINELYIISDFLVTDYSSVFFDYAILNRPIFFYMYDMETYRDEIRGFYIDVNQLPGPILSTEKELVEAIQNINLENYYKDYSLNMFNKIYNSHNDGRATERLVNKVIE